MKNVKIISVVLAIAMLLNICTPVAYATETINMENVSVSGDIALYGFENEEMLYNLMINTATGTGQFAIKYANDYDTVYEYVFGVLDSADISKSSFWKETIDMCFNCSAEWNSILLPGAVRVIDESSNTESTYAVDSHIAFFKNYLVNLYGPEYYENELRSTSQNGVTMTQYQAKYHRVSKDYTYVITATITVLGFVTGVLGLNPTAGIVATLGFVAGTAGLFTLGQKVYEYSLVTDWCRYVTIDGGSYPYNMTDKFVLFTGYVYTETDNEAVDDSSIQTIYSDSEAYYLRYTLQFEDAYEEYLKIGWQG